MSPYIGARMLRKEDPRLVRGGQYVADVQRPGMLHAAILRSEYAHARLTAVDVSAARALPGVAGAWAYADLAADLTPIPVRIANRPGLGRALQLPIAPGTVRYVGEPVAVVVARSRYEAEDALEAMRVTYEPLSVCTRVEDAAPDDVVESFTVCTGEVDAAFAAAPVVIRASFRTNRHAGVPMETRGLVAEWDAGRGELTVWGPTKAVHINRATLANMLHLPEARVRFIEVDVGGGFGTRGEFYPEDFLVPYLARRLGRPVRWIEDRREHLMTANHSREQRHEVELAARADGTVLALRDRMDIDMGAYIRTHGVVVPELAAAFLPGPYAFSAYRCDVRCVLTNKTPIGTYRGPGRFETSFVRERLLDLLAQRVGLDPAEVRRRNLIRPDQLPFDRGTEAMEVRTIFDSGDYPSLFARALAQFDYDGARAAQAGARAEGRQLGIGIGCFMEKTGHGPWEYARVDVDASGEVQVLSGGGSLGQGLETVLAQICADHLGCGYEEVTVRHGDTALVPFGVGSWASRQTTLGGAAVAEAATEVRARALAVAAQLLEARPDDLEVAGGRLRVAGTDRAVTFGDVARACRPPQGLGLSASAVYRTQTMSYPFGLHLALVEVDPGSGKVQVLRYLVAYDVGRAVNPTLVEGQITGGLGQGVGGALLEEFSYDDAGQLRSGTLMDYLLPTALDVPRVDFLVDEVPTDRNPLGVKGAGEAGITGAAAAIANAVADATGAGVDQLPLSPETVWRAARRGRRDE